MGCSNGNLPEHDESNGEVRGSLQASQLVGPVQSYPTGKLAKASSLTKLGKQQSTRRESMKSKAGIPLPEDDLGSMRYRPMIGLNAMLRAKSTLEDFCRSYFMFHELNVNDPADLFRHLPFLTFVESYIYQLDEQNEEEVHQFCEETQMMQHASQGEAGKASGGSGQNPFHELEACLSEEGLLTERIQQKLQDGLQYWSLEQSLCRSMVTGGNISIEDVMLAIRLKSFDYQVLNLLMYELRHKQVNEAHVEYLVASELLVEISDDLYDYEEDVLKNSFNFLRMLVRVHGPVEAPKMLAECISEAEAKYEEQVQRLEPSLAAQCQKRCEEAVAEGGGGKEHPLGSWSIPSLIVDEAGYRMRVQASNCG